MICLKGLEKKCFPFQHLNLYIFPDLKSIISFLGAELLFDFLRLKLRVCYSVYRQLKINIISLANYYSCKPGFVDYINEEI